LAAKIGVRISGKQLASDLWASFKNPFWINLFWVIEEPKKDIAAFASALHSVVKIPCRFHHGRIRVVIGSRDHLVMLDAQGHTKPTAVVSTRHMVPFRRRPITKCASFLHRHAAPTKE
jgi:hypothetical protein